MNRPVHISIRDDLRMRLNAGEWAAGDRLPSETELAARYGVARMTIRQAIGALASDGAVIRRQGLGTFAADRRPTRTADLLLSFTEEMRRQGRQVETILISAAVEQPPPAAREALRAGPSAAAVAVRRVRLVDGCPIVVQNSWLPYARFAGLDADPLLDGSLYARLEAQYGVRIMRARQSITAAAVMDCLARMIRTPYRASSIAYREPSSSGSASRPAKRAYGSHEFCTTTGQPSTTRTRRTATAAADGPSCNASRAAGGGCSTAA